MPNENYSMDDIANYLASHAPIECFYVLCSPDNKAILLNFFDAYGKSWTIMEDDDDLFNGAVTFLKKSEAPFFNNRSSMVEFERSMASKIRLSTFRDHVKSKKYALPLRAVVVDFIANGISKDSMLSDLTQLMLEFRSEGKDNDENLIADALDFLVGWCAPHLRI